MMDRVKFFDSYSNLPSSFLTKEYIYAKHQPPTRVIEDRRHVKEKVMILKATRRWPACSDFKRLTRRVEDIHHIRSGRSYRTLRRRLIPSSQYYSERVILNFSY